MNVDESILFLDFVKERHRIYVDRLTGRPWPWTTDPILASRKFTNVFRILDPGSQFVFELESENPLDVLWRLVLYRHTNRPEAWRAYATDLGRYPTRFDASDLLEFWSQSGERVFSGAYMIYPQSSVPGTNKIESVIDLANRVVREAGDRFINSEDPMEQFNILRSFKGLGDFMASQILTDWGYTAHCGEDIEEKFDAMGPGAIKGAKILDGQRDSKSVMYEIRGMLLTDPECPWILHRLPSLRDVQNCLCEFSKYYRYLLSPATPKPYTPAHPGLQSEPRLPAHWYERRN